MNRQQTALKWILVVGIVIVLNLFFAFAIKLFYDAPEFQDFCPEKQVETSIANKESCVEAGGKWTEHVAERPVPVSFDGEMQSGWCDVHFTCRTAYEDARDVYNRNVFVVHVVLGVLSITIGIFLSGIASISLGLSLGGVLSLVIGSLRYWSSMDDVLRVIILGVALVVLLWLGAKKLRDE